jgi:hypothetical protein
MHKAGWKGRKSGRGFYAYATGESPPQPNDLLEPLIAQYLRRSTAPPGADEIVRRLLMVMVNQAADVLAENVVSDPVISTRHSCTALRTSRRADIGRDGRITLIDEMPWSAGAIRATIPPSSDQMTDLIPTNLFFRRVL